MLRNISKFALASVALAAAALPLSPLGGTSSAADLPTAVASAADFGEVPSEQAVVQMAKRWATTESAARRRLEVEPAAQSLTDALRAGPEKSFAGAWWGEGASMELNVAMRGGANEVALQRRLPADVKVTVHDAPYSEADLDRASLRVQRLSEAERQPVRQFGVGPAPQTGSLVVDYAGPQPAFEQAVRRAASPVPVSFEYGSPPETASCTSRNNCAELPARGGLRFTPPGCTTGFNATDSAGNRGVITAKHCVDVDMRVAHDGVDLGRVTHISYVETWDAAFIKYVEPFRSGARNIIYRSGAQPQFVIHQVSSSTNFTLGNTHCHVGTGSFFEQCGPVSRNNYSYYDSQNRLWETLYRFDACATGGDSGGPSYSPGGTGAGIVNGGVLRSCPDSSSRTLALYINSASTSLYANVLTN